MGLRHINGIKKIFILCCLPIFLSACVPAALVIGATAGGAVIYDKRSMHTIVQDKEATSIAAHKIDTDPTLKKGTHIVVAVFNHILLLVGQTKTQPQRDKAYALVQGTKNINRIYNEITIQKPSSIWQRSKDTWITTKAKTEMLARKGLHSTQIKVVTENGVVYLMGVVTHGQANLAADVARRINGVKKVVKVFQYPQ